MTKPATTPQFYAESVRGQYEILPYPARDPEKELATFYTGDCFSLDALNHMGWGGKRDFRKGFRVLVAGEGTGDVPVFMAEQLRGSENVEIVAIDLSSSSIAIAKKRLEVRGLSHLVTHHHMSILDLPNAGLGQFDAIECGGVLHHLDSPEEGLAALASVLKPDGVMSIMVYAFYGRLAVYMIQVLMHFLMDADAHPQTKLDIAREFLNAIPPTHWLAHTLNRYQNEIEEPTGSGAYDLFLHSTDRAYTVPQIYDWVEGAGLTFGGFCAEWSGRAAYMPETYTKSPLIRAIVAEKPERERQTIAELMNGTIRKHFFYASKRHLPAATFDEEMFVILSLRQTTYPDFIPTLCAELAPLAVGDQLYQTVTTLRAPVLIVTKNTHTIALLEQFLETQTIGEWIDLVTKKTTAKRADVRTDLEQLYEELHRCLRVYLRHPSVPPYRSAMEVMMHHKKNRENA